MAFATSVWTTRNQFAKSISRPTTIPHRIQPVTSHSVHRVLYPNFSFVDKMLKNHIIKFALLSLLFLLPLIACSQRNNLFPITLIHLNDFHARFEETNEYGNKCKTDENEVCIGGYARAVTVIKQLQKSRSNPIFLNAGDNFAGTIWYTIGRWNVTSYFLNLLKADVMTIGNHEFDHSVDGLIPFLETIESPVVLANVDITNELGLQNKFNKSIVITRSGKKIGIIGALNRYTYEISTTGKVRFLDESDSIRKEAAELKGQGIDIIIVLSHCGLDVDFEIAKKAGPNIDVIVGGHTHSFMYTGAHPPGPDKPVDKYPAVVTQDSGRKVLIVQASAYAKYIGDLTVYFDEAGEVSRWKGAPIFLGQNIQQDKSILEKMQPWKNAFDKMANQKLIDTSMTIDNSDCYRTECLMGNFMTDIYLNYYRDNYKSIENPSTLSPTIALLQAGGIRTTLTKGSITLGDLISVIPFGDSIDALDLTGQHLWDAFEHSVKRQIGTTTNYYLINLLQVSGLKVVLNITKPIGNRIVSIDIFCHDCLMPHYEPVDLMRSYRIVISSFLAHGGDGFTAIKKHKKNYIVGQLDIDISVAYLKGKDAVKDVKKSDRITVLR